MTITPFWAEDITSRFLNVIGLFNGFIPLIALQMSALKFGDQITLVFTKVLDAVALGMPEEDEEVQAVTDRAYWEQRTTKETLGLVDEMFDMVKTFAPELELKYNKFYIGVARDGQPNNFVIFRPKRNSFRAEIRLGSSPDIDQQLENAGIDVMDYETRWGRYRLRLVRNDLKKHSELLLKLFKMSYGIDTEVGGKTLTAKA
jgi:ClpP class serine protease